MNVSYINIQVDGLMEQYIMPYIPFIMSYMNVNSALILLIFVDIAFNIFSLIQKRKKFKPYKKLLKYRMCIDTEKHYSVIHPLFESYPKLRYINHVIKERYFESLLEFLNAHPVYAKSWKCSPAKPRSSPIQPIVAPRKISIDDNFYHDPEKSLLQRCIKTCDDDKCLNLPHFGLQDKCKAHSNIYVKNKITGKMETLYPRDDQGFSLYLHPEIHNDYISSIIFSKEGYAISRVKNGEFELVSESDIKDISKRGYSVKRI